MARTRKDKGTEPERSVDFEPKDWHCVAFLATVVAIFFHQILLGDAYLWEDFLYHDYPSRNFAAVSLANGELPLWNPYTFNGMPFLADIQKTVLYLPCAALTLFAQGDRLDPYWLELMIILHFVLAGVTMFFLGKSFGMRRIPALFAGMTFMLSGFMIMHAIHQYIVTLVAWYPLVLLLFRKALAEGWKWAFAASIVLGHSTLAGFPQLSLFLYLFLGVFFVVEMTTTHRGGRLFSPPALSATVRAGAVIILSVAVAAVQLLPTMELAELSVRAQITYEKATEGQLHPMQLITLLFPKFFGTAGAHGSSYWGPGTYWYFWETCLYLGVLPLILTILSVLFIRTSKYSAFFLSYAVFALLFALGDSLFLHRLFFDVVPGFSTFRNPARMGVFLTLGAALLSGFCLQYLFYAKPEAGVRMRWQTAILVGAGCMVVVWSLIVSGVLPEAFGMPKSPEVLAATVRSSHVALLLYVLAGTCLLLVLKNRRRIVLIAAVFALQFFDMIYFGMDQNTSRVNPVEYFQRSRQLVEYLKSEGERELFRVNMRNQYGMLMDRNQGLMDRIQLMEGYTPLVLQRVNPPGRDFDQVCDMMNVRFRAVSDERNPRALSLRDATTHLPRAYVVYAARVFPDSSDLVAFMESGEFEPRKMVVLEEPAPFPSASNGFHEGWAAEVTAYKLNSMSIAVTTPSDGYLVVSEVFYPGWNAYVNGERQRVYRANWNQRMVPLPAGTHTVHMVYEPASFQMGMWITLGTLGVCVGGIIIPAMPRRHSTKHEA